MYDLELLIQPKPIFKKFCFFVSSSFHNYLTCLLKQTKTVTTLTTTKDEIYSGPGSSPDSTISLLDKLRHSMSLCEHFPQLHNEKIVGDTM